MTNFEISENDQILISDILGYLNFSEGSCDTRFISAWNDLYSSLSAQGSSELWYDALHLLNSELERLEKSGGIFKDSRQAKQALLVVEKVLSAYREFHQDTLFKLENSYLFNSFFMARVCQTVTGSSLFDEEKFQSGELVAELLTQLNDFLGYRPIPTLEGEEKHEPNPHEWISPLPLYYEGAGVAFGPYKVVVEIALKILQETDQDILLDASFDPKKLRELAVDPRPYDFDHPVHRRLNYSFGVWDDRCIDENGFFRRFIVHRATLDALMSFVWQEKDPDLVYQRQYETAAILAGTMLMASGVDGGYVQAHDSSVTLSTLTPIIASYRDLFYERLLAKTPEPLKERLVLESKQLFQPFAGARQYLNHYLAKQRADQIQRFSLARTYARMGYFEASRRQTKIIETTSSRILSQIDCFITESHLVADEEKIEEAAAFMPKIEELLFRGIACGAFPDPWFIIGFDAEYGLFQSAEDVVHDHRIDGLIDLLNDIFDLYSRLQKESAALGKDDLWLTLSDQMSDLASWWDQFGSQEISSIDGFSGQTIWESANQVSRALAAWNKAGKAIGDVAFWSKHVQRFNSPKAFVLLCEALLDKNDLISSSSLLIYWLNQSDKIPLTESDYSFHSVMFNWLEQVWNPEIQGSSRSQLRRRTSLALNDQWSLEEYAQRWELTKKFIARVEANADAYWSVPEFNLASDKFDRKIAFDTDNPVIADLTRRLFLAVKYLGKTKEGIPKLSLRSSFKDAARAVDVNTLPSPEGFKKFYADNRKAFPRFLTFPIFVQIVLNEVRMSSRQRQQYREQLFGSSGNATLTVSDPSFSNAPSNESDLNASPEDENSSRQKRLWNEIVEELSGDEKIGNAQDLIRRLLEKKSKSSELEENIDSEDDLVSIEDFDDFSDEFGIDDESFDDDLDSSNGDMFEEDNEEDEDSITGGDPTFRAAYEGMVYSDSADDGIDDDTVEGNSHFKPQSESNEFAKETDRITDRLTFIYSIVKMWEFSAGKSPLLSVLSVGALDEQATSEARLCLEDWLSQALTFEHDLYELLDQASRYRIPNPSSTAESLVEYDQARGAKEIVLDRIVWTLVEVKDAVLFLKSILRDNSSEKFEKPWKTVVLLIFSAIFRRDVNQIKQHWNQLLKSLERETLLYIPTSRGGDAKAVVDCRYLQQVVILLLQYLPRLGLIQETFQLLSCVQKMEQIRLSSPGSTTEYDRLVETVTRSITETLAESSKTWKSTSSDIKSDVLENEDEQLVYCLVNATDVVLKSWLSHSQQIRISSVEAIVADKNWEMVKNFIQKYGADLFTQRFLAFRNIRAILQHGVSGYLESLLELKKEDNEIENGDKLITALLEGQEEISQVASLLEIILECIAENYSEYVDYNSTTTQSDNGEKLYMLLDFLRTLSNYERVSWNLKPIYWAHDSLIRSGYPKEAEQWKDRIKQKSSRLAEDNLNKFEGLKRKYGIWLASVYDRLQERFVRPLDIAQMCGKVFDAITEVRNHGENNALFQKLEREIETFAADPSGIVFELPEWLTQLQDEVILARVDCKEEYRKRDSQNDPFEMVSLVPIEKISPEEVERQIHLALNDVRFRNNGVFRRM